MTEQKIKLVPALRGETHAPSAARGDRSRVPRAKRYEISTATKYRIRGEKEWHDGVIKNMSISGVLFGTAFSLPLEAAIEMRFSLPIQLGGAESAAEVLCRALVARSWKCALAGEGAAMVAARITHSRFFRQKK